MRNVLINEYLKIKDDVDLNLLFHFGFREFHIGYAGLIYYCYDDLLIDPKTRKFVIFKLRERELFVFFNLVSAGLVEKVVV